jgi:hypothetical protein
MHFQTCKRYVVYSHTCMSTYVRVLSPSKTEAGSEDSWLWSRESSLWGGGRTQSDLHSFSISPSLRLRQCIQCVCARVCQCCTRAYPKKQPRQVSTRVNGHSSANARNMHSKLRTYTSYGNVQSHVYVVNEVIVPHYTHDKRYVIYFHRT